MNISIKSKEEQIVWDWMNEIPDPEIPVVSIVELGMVRKVDIKELDENGNIKSLAIGITPTYSACPAVDMIRMQIDIKIRSHNIEDVEVYEILYPAWTTDWMSEETNEKLRKYGIAPPNRSKEGLALFEHALVPCPKCNSEDTKKISNFGSTSCKALYQCNECKEPFEHFKCH